MAKKKIDGAATAASEPAVSVTGSLDTAPKFDAVNYGVISIDTAIKTEANDQSSSEYGTFESIRIIVSTPAERDLNILIEAQKIRRDPARFMAAKALPAAQKHYIV